MTHETVPLETLVKYHGRLYRIFKHFPDEEETMLYGLWPENLLRKMGNRHYSVIYVRRKSFEIEPE